MPNPDSEFCKYTELMLEVLHDAGANYESHFPATYHLPSDRAGLVSLWWITTVRVTTSICRRLTDFDQESWVSVTRAYGQFWSDWVAVANSLLSSSDLVDGPSLTGSGAPSEVARDSVRGVLLSSWAMAQLQQSGRSGTDFEAAMFVSSFTSAVRRDLLSVIALAPAYWARTRSRVEGGPHAEHTPEEYLRDVGELDSEARPVLEEHRRLYSSYMSETRLNKAASVQSALGHTVSVLMSALREDAAGGEDEHAH